MRLPAAPTSASCPHRPPCSGCPRFGDEGLAPTALATLAALAHQHGLPPVEVTSGATTGFRMRARLAIRGRLGSPKIGLFEAGTHRVVHTPHCCVQHPLINRVASVVRRALVDSRVTCYSDGAHLGLARYLQVVIERRSQTAQVVLVANAVDVAPLATCLDMIRERLGTGLHSLWCNSQVERSNTILGSEFHHWVGPASVVEHYGGAAIHYPPGAFGQSNLDIAELIIDAVRGELLPNARVTEFYAGVGAIGLSLLDRVAALTLNEVSPQSAYGMQLGLAELSPSARRQVSVVPGTAAQSLLAAADAHIVIADPPRRGLDAELIDHLIAHAPQRFIYISCGLQSFLADTQRLTSSGRLRLSKLRAFNLLPFTEHVETVAVFDRT